MSEYTPKDFAPGDWVQYVPHHAFGDRCHVDCRWGKVSSCNDKFVFVKFREQLKMHGWDGTTSQACDPTTLEKSNE